MTINPIVSAGAVAVALVAGLTGGAAVAEDFKPPADTPMEVHLVRSDAPGCEPDCPEWIAAQGQIDETTVARFRRVFARLGSRKVPVLLHSAGGEVDPALTIARMIRQRGLDVAVTRTELTSCPPRDAKCRQRASKGANPGRAKARISICASACAFILAGGVRRYVGPQTVVGLHQITSYQQRFKILRRYEIRTRTQWGVPVEERRRLISETRIPQGTVKLPTRSETYDRVQAHFVAMGVSPHVMPILLSTPATRIRWLTRAELTGTGMATDIGATGESLIAARSQPVVAAAAPVAGGETTEPMPAAAALAAGSAPAGTPTVASTPAAAAAPAAASPPANEPSRRTAGLPTTTQKTPAAVEATPAVRKPAPKPRKQIARRTSPTGGQSQQPGWTYDFGGR